MTARIRERGSFGFSGSRIARYLKDHDHAKQQLDAVQRALPVQRDSHEGEDAGGHGHVGKKVVDCAIDVAEGPMSV